MNLKDVGCASFQISSEPGQGQQDQRQSRQEREQLPPVRALPAPQTEQADRACIGDGDQYGRLPDGIAQSPEEAAQKNGAGLFSAQCPEVKQAGQNGHGKKWHIQHERIRHHQHDRA